MVASSILSPGNLNMGETWASNVGRDYKTSLTKAKQNVLYLIMGVF